MAISTRNDESGSNAFSLARMLVPTGEMPIAERFTAIQAAADAAREANATGVARDARGGRLGIADVADHPPGPSAGPDRRLRDINVRGAPVPMYVAGAKMLENYPVGPLAGVAFNLTLLSYNHSLDMGVNIDTAAVTEPELLRECLEKAFNDLISAPI